MTQKLVGMTFLNGYTMTLSCGSDITQQKFDKNIALRYAFLLFKLLINNQIYRRVIS